MSAEYPDSQTPSGTFEIQLDIWWGDMDALRHVNNVAYFRYFEEARVRLFRAMDLEPSKGRYCVLAHASCDFLKPLLYPASIVVGMTLVRVGQTSIELDCWIASADNPENRHAHGRNVLVCTDGATGRPVPWTSADRHMLAHCFSH
ncbi:acyl-CoA thioesterase [Castellaniella sp.]|uniref:acyl-CoA thioesterase n=1 Tax=Castellaniella sp. TaxID=1955812 RepID=UPI003C791D04